MKAARKQDSGRDSNGGTITGRPKTREATPVVRPCMYLEQQGERSKSNE